ncbi:hypothetical protein [Edaphobacter bradus]|uniref:hypothetical protein n=1 Tax=Edaphobacter bradus TaxID=2259016 RepID=UPI0021DFFA69|nr:hypothetical protein [Edaphobacter bradus]
MSLVRAPFSIVSGGMLRSASLLVPVSQRDTWLEEWRSELWYVGQAVLSEDLPFFVRERQTATFCLGAFHDALYLRRERKALIARTVRPSRSALRTTAALFVLAMLSFGAALLLPRVQSVLRPSPYRDTPNLVLISPPGTAHNETPQMCMRHFRFWQGRTRHMFSEFAFYDLIVKQIHTASHRTSELRIARVSANLFPMLGVQPPSAVGEAPLPVLLVSPAVWQQQFHGDTISVGSTVKVGIRKAAFGGILSNNQWRLPGSFDAWLIEPDTDPSTIPDTARGYILARRIPSVDNAALGDHWGMAAPEPDGGFASYEFTALSSTDRIPAAIYIFTLLLALLALPATTSLPLGEYPADSERISWPLRLRRWMFLVVKFSLLLPTIYFASLDLAYAFPAAPSTVQYIQIVASFLMALFSFRWALKDQRRRCPVCLSTLTNPARVGEPSRNFLAWNGTELICTGGHGLLHVPELPTSWFATQRWLYLDSSWSGVFLGRT